MDNPEHAKELGAAWQRNNPDKVRIRNAKWEKKNPDKVKAKAKRNREKRMLDPIKRQQVSVRVIKWQRDNPEKANAKNARRRASKLQATPAWANQEKIEEFYYTAQMLGMHTGEPYHVDHIVPLKSKFVCGLHCEANLQILEGKENSRKSNRIWPGMP